VPESQAEAPLDSSTMEAFYVSLLVVVGLAVAWFAGYVIYKLFRGQS
jgi:hypothetical protein